MESVQAIRIEPHPMCSTCGHTAVLKGNDDGPVLVIAAESMRSEAHSERHVGSPQACSVADCAPDDGHIVRDLLRLLARYLLVLHGTVNHDNMLPAAEIAHLDADQLGDTGQTAQTFLCLLLASGSYFPSIVSQSRMPRGPVRAACPWSGCEDGFAASTSGETTCWRMASSARKGRGPRPDFDNDRRNPEAYIDLAVSRGDVAHLMSFIVTPRR